MHHHLFFTASLLVSLTFLPMFTSCQNPAGDGYEDRPELPEGAAGERIRALIAAINHYDPDRLAQFLTEHATASFAGLPAEDHRRAFYGLRRETGGVDFHRIRTYTPPRPETIVVIVRDRNFGSWRSLSLHLAPEEENRIAGLNFSPARTPADVPAPGRLSEGELVREATELLDRLCKQDVFSGAVLIADGDRVLLERACGEATKAFHVPNNIDTKFNLGSMNKMFTAAAVVQLAEKGLLTYEDPISRFIDESWLPDSITGRVTVHHLLTHTSGLGSYFNETYWQSSRERFKQLDDYKPLIQGETLAFRPGERFRYSNTGMFLLGVIIEKATGQNYFDYIREHVYRPAGMENSDSYELDYPIENLAVGYIPDPGSPYGWQNNLFKHVIKGGPAGGGYSTVHDLHRFARALQTGKLIGENSLEKMWTSHSDAGYGYGFSVEESATGKVVGHGGGFPGLNGQLDIFTGRRYIVIVLSNYDHGAGPVAEKIREMIGRLEEM